MDAIGMIEVTNIPTGIEAGDQMLKAASVELLMAQSICPGKFMVLIKGNVSAVKSSIETVKEKFGQYLVNQIIIPNVHPQVFKAISCSSEIKDVRALGVVESFSVASSVVMADTAVKTADVELIEVRLGTGLGGKSFITMTGDVSAVRYAIENIRETYKADGFISNSVVIPSLHEDMKRALL